MKCDTFLELFNNSYLINNALKLFNPSIHDFFYFYENNRLKSIYRFNDRKNSIKL